MDLSFSRNELITQAQFMLEECAAKKAALDAEVQKQIDEIKQTHVKRYGFLWKHERSLTDEEAADEYMSIKTRDGWLWDDNDIAHQVATKRSLRLKRMLRALKASEAGRPVQLTEDDFAFLYSESRPVGWIASP